MLRILHLEDDDLDAELVRTYIENVSDVVEIVRARDEAEYARSLADRRVDVVISDFRLPGYDGFAALAAARAVDVELPFIFVSGAIGEDLAIETLRRGATDYVLKERLDRLPSAIRRAVELATERVRRRAAEAERDALLATERRARELAEAANRMKDEFLAVVSHELRTPLNAILGWAQLLTPDSGREVLAKGLATIERNVKVQVRLIEDLLDIARATTGKLQLHVDRTPVASFVMAAADALRPAADARSIDFSVDVAPGMTIVGDSDRLQQVVWNLAANAVKFTPVGGRVAVSATQEGDDLVIRVIDNGRGIEPAFLPHVFERFRQADATPSRSLGGIGLGLAIVRHLVELHGGTVTAHSDGLGRGSCFEVRVPMRTSPAGPVEVAPVPHRAEGIAGGRPLEGVHVLVVEDDPDTRDLVQLVLERHGARVSVAATAGRGLELLATRPDVIVSDIGLPEVDGYAFMRRLRALAPAEGGATPAIALTAYTREGDLRQAHVAGFQRHVPKPVQVRTLIAAVGELARPSRGAAP